MLLRLARISWFHKLHFHALITSMVENQHANGRNIQCPTSTFLSDTSLVKTTSEKMGYHQGIISANKTITRYFRSGDLDSALKVFYSMPIKTTITWNSMLSGFSKNCRSTEEARKMFDEIPEPDTVSYNIMLSCYIINRNINVARNFFDKIPIKDTASWNTMVSGFAHEGMITEARELFMKMPTRNCVSWGAMVSGYVESGDFNSAVEFFKAVPVECVEASTAMISGYMKFGKVELAEQVFSNMKIKNLVTWNAMISGYVENSRADDGLKLFKSMQQFSIRFNPSSLSSVLLGCSELSALQFGKQVHQVVCKSPIFKNTTTTTSLISMYCKCGSLEDACKLFLHSPYKDVVTWNAMISGYAQHGEGGKALCLFDEMRAKGIKPDWITLIAVLLACRHTGLVQLGMQYFNFMSRDYGVEPKLDHYACMVDLLGRAGKLNEAVDLIKEMPFNPHVAIYATLLGACRIHKNIQVAEFAAQSLLKLDPMSAGCYVQLANVHAALGRWDDVSSVRRSMKDKKVVKMPGYSWLEVRSVVHRFRSGDKIHPELANIQKKLNELEKKIKLAGYVADLEFELHDVGNKVKQELLLSHSEKLAIAFGLMKVRLGTPVRVFKNLRVCGDCHSFIKYVSAVENREIIVRDTSRFHHFKNGICSCGDYW